MILIFKAIIMGIVEGITEFLPISSTGHMIIIGHFISFAPMVGSSIYTKDYIDMFEVVIQLGAILAIIVLFWNKIFNSLKMKNIMPGGWGFKLWLNLFVAFLPVGILGLLLNKKIDKYLMDNPYAVAFALLIGGILMILIENKYRKRHTTSSIEKVSLKQAFMIGIFQCLSLWPGMSRSASTIMGAWVCGLSTVAAAEFSFFLSIPTMIVATLYKLIQVKIVMDTYQVIALAAGFLVSFIVALLVVEKFINFLKRKPMRIFAVYRIFVGVCLLGLALFKVISL
jgi:undecaprenyl-diphosphatase